MRFSTCLLLALLCGSLLSAPLSIPAADFYAAPSADPATGTGTIESPLPLATALSATSPVHAGDKLWLRGGTYSGFFTSWLTGTAAAPIIVRAYPGEQPVIDSGATPTKTTLSIKGGYAHFWGLEIMNSDPTRINPVGGSNPPNERGEGLYVVAPGTKIINCIVHDCAVGIGMWSLAPDSEAYGNIIFNNGWEGPDRGHGHGIYSQNKTGTKLLSDNISFNNFADGIQAYGSDAAYLDNFTITGNVLFNCAALTASNFSGKNLLVGGGRIANNLQVLNNYTYHVRSGQENNLGYIAGISNGVVKNNYFVGHTALELVNFQGTMTNNLLYGGLVGFSAASKPGNQYYSSSSRPTTPKVVVRRNKYDPKRGFAVVYNWNRVNFVSLDIKQIVQLNKPFTVRDAQNPRGPVEASGIFRGQPVYVPMGLTDVIQPIGGSPRAAVHTDREFGVFLIEQVQ